MLQFADKVVLVTGGASGIGRATAVAFGHAGATVILADVDEAGAQETVAEVAAVGGVAHFVQTDVVQQPAVEALVAEIVAQQGRLDIAINNAGVEGALARTADVEESDADRLLDINVKGVWLCMKYELQQMLQQGRGAIVNMASVAGLVGAHSLPMYAASKHAVVGLTKSAAVEYARKGIRVNAVCPSFIRTPMIERAAEALPTFAEAAVANHPSRRLGEAKEVAAAILWLASDEASFVNGAALAVDGAFTAQ